MSTLDAENFPPIPEDEVERMREVAVAAEGLSFDDLATGEIPVRGVRVASTPRLAEPVPAVAGLAGELPTIVPMYKPLRDEPAIFWVAVGAGIIAAGFVAVWAMLAVGGYLGGA